MADCKRISRTLSSSFVPPLCASKQYVETTSGRIPHIFITLHDRAVTTTNMECGGSPPLLRSQPTGDEQRPPTNRIGILATPMQPFDNPRRVPSGPIIPA